jgi:hypothetical protein
MMKTGFWQLVLASTLVCLTGIAGCGSKKGSVVNGKVVLPAGAHLDKDDSGTITFVPEKADKSGKGGGAGPINPSDLTFFARDIAPGKYKIKVNLSAYPGKENEKRAKVLEGINQHFDDANTKLTYEVTADAQQSITIDLAHGTVSKQ